MRRRFPTLPEFKRSRLAALAALLALLFATALPPAFARPAVAAGDVHVQHAHHGHMAAAQAAEPAGTLCQHGCGACGECVLCSMAAFAVPEPAVPGFVVVAYAAAEDLAPDGRDGGPPGKPPRS